MICNTRVLARCTFLVLLELAAHFIAAQGVAILGARSGIRRAQLLSVRRAVERPH